MVATSRHLASVLCLSYLTTAYIRTTHFSDSSNAVGSAHNSGSSHNGAPGPGNPPASEEPSAPVTNPTTPTDAGDPGAWSGTVPNDLRRELAAEYWEIFPQHLDFASNPIAGVHLESYEGASQRETIAMFSGIPAEATDCTFGWISDTPDDRVFLTKLTIIEGGSSDIVSFARQLSGFPADGTPVSFNSILPFDNVPVETVSQTDFLNWDSPTIERPSGVSGAGNLNCSETIYIRLGIDTPDSEKRVYMESGERSGLFVQYTI